MKNKRFIIATLLVVVATTVAIVSCKKNDASEQAGVKSNLPNAFNPDLIDDMNAYLKDFKQKMQSAKNGDDEMLSIEEAAWHLSSVANYDFGHANVEYDDVRFDTLYFQVTVTNGNILLSDLAIAYDEIHTSIDKFYHSLALNNKHFRFINAFVSENGEVAISLLTTFSNGSKYLSDTCWYFDDEWDAYSSCYYYFDATSYPVYTTGTTELQRALNLVVSRPINTVIGNVYYTLSSTKVFYYRNYIDPFGSPSYMNSRLFASNTCTNCDIVDNICYYFDSYLGLGHEYIPMDKYILSWTLELKPEAPLPGEQHSKVFHELTVTYGVPTNVGTMPGPGDY